MSLNFMAGITISSDFGAKKNKVWHCFHCFPIYLPWSDGTRCHDLSFLNAELYAKFLTLLFPSIFPSVRVFSNESALRIRWPKCWSFSFNISPSSEHPGLISFRMDWLDLLAVQGSLKSLLQHHGSKASILQHSAFFIVQLSHSYMTTG